MGTSALPGAPQGSARSDGTAAGVVGAFGSLSAPSLPMTYGNASSPPGVNSYTFINTVAPGLLFSLGSHWTLDYTPSRLPLFRFRFPRHHGPNGDAQMAAHDLRDWTLDLSQSYVDTTQPLVETGETAQEAYTTALNAAWQMNDKMALQLGLNQDFRFIRGT